MRKFKFVDSWSFYAGFRTREIGIFEADTLEKAIKQAEKVDNEVCSDRIASLVEVRKGFWSMLGNWCPHYIEIYEIL